MSFYNGNGGSGSGTVLQQPVTLNGLVHLQIGDSTVTFSNVISGTGGFYWDNYNNTVVFAAANTYQGITDLRSGRTLALAGAGSIATSTNIQLTGATVDVTRRADQTLTLSAVQTLQGNGTITGNLTVGAGANVSPGGAGTIGTLTATGTVTLAGNTTMELNQTAGTSDQITTPGAIVYGGTLNVANLAGTLAAGQSFTLFSGGSYSGSFANIVPATPGAGLTWDTSALATSGTLKIVGGTVQPNISHVTISGTTITISGSSGSTGTYHVLASTNLTVPVASWTVVGSGTFGPSGTFSSTINISSSNAQQYYAIKTP
jgi:hypothetical protein